MEKKQLNSPIEIKTIDAETGVFSGYASVFGVVDSHNDIVLAGAFKKSLKKNGSVKLLWQHRMDEPIGVIITLKEDKKGLFIEGKLLLDVQKGKEAHALAKEGALGGMSIGYSVRDYDVDGKTNIRKLIEIELWEVSFVTFPANEDATLDAVKSQSLNNIKEFETFLREAGISRDHAKYIACKGWISEQKMREVDELKKSVSEPLNKLIKTIRG